MQCKLNLVTRQELLQAINEATPEQPVRCATLNPEIILTAQANPEFQAALADMTHCCVDGFGLYLALQFWCLLHRQHIPIEHYQGADLVAELISRYSDGTRRFYFFGGTERENGGAVSTLVRQHPTLKIAGYQSGGVIPVSQVQVIPQIRHKILRSKPDILLVGLGAPKQELWIQAASTFPVPVMIGVGGTFGFYSTKRRAPGSIRRLKLEWLWRGVTEPGHWRRLWRAVVVFPICSMFYTVTHWGGTD